LIGFRVCFGSADPTHEAVKWPSQKAENCHSNYCQQAQSIRNEFHSRPRADICQCIVGEHKSQCAGPEHHYGETISHAHACSSTNRPFQLITACTSEDEDSRIDPGGIAEISQGAATPPEQILTQVTTPAGVAHASEINNVPTLPQSAL
jgi:hypothetical protein